MVPWPVELYLGYLYRAKDGGISKPAAAARASVARDPWDKQLSAWNEEREIIRAEVTNILKKNWRGHPGADGRNCRGGECNCHGGRRQQT